MSALVPDQLSLLDRAAELRAAGVAMTAAAERLKLTPDELRALIGGHRRDFQRLSRRAEREFDAELRRVALAKLMELMRGTNEAAAMFAAGTVIRYELARMRDDARRRRDSAGHSHGRPRNELPPPPSRNVTAQSLACDTGCDRPVAAPQVQIQKPVAPQSPVHAQSRCDTVPAVVPVAVTPPPAPLHAAVPSPPDGLPRGKTTMVDAIRKKKWLPPGLSR
jgi:hypothetical protein